MMKQRKQTAVAVVLACAAMGAQAQDRAWLDKSKSADERARAAVAAMTLDEKLLLIVSYTDKKRPGEAAGRYRAARGQGRRRGAPHRGLGRLRARHRAPRHSAAMADRRGRSASRTQGGAQKARAHGAAVRPGHRGHLGSRSWSAAGGAMIGARGARLGFNVMLAGGVNLVREPRNGRNFEYGGEDPLLAGMIVGAQITGIQSNHIISTIKHFASTTRKPTATTVNVDHRPRAGAHVGPARVPDRHRAVESRLGDVLVQPGQRRARLRERLPAERGAASSDWGWQGLRDVGLGRVHRPRRPPTPGSTSNPAIPVRRPAVLRRAALKAAWQSGEVTRGAARRDGAAHPAHAVRQGRDRPSGEDRGTIDFAAHAAVARARRGSRLRAAEERGRAAAAARTRKRIAVIGGHADKGVLAGGGSSLVYPVGGNAVPGLEPTSWPGPIMYYPSSPLQAHQGASCRRRRSPTRAARIAAAAARWPQAATSRSCSPRSGTASRRIRRSTLDGQPGRADRRGRQRQSQARWWCSRPAAPC